MYLANPWGLLGLLALPAIIVLHLYQRRFPELVVAGLHLWADEDHVPTSGRRRDRLPLSASLFLELLAALAATLGLVDLRFGDLGRAVHQIVILDDSASMSAVGSDGQTFRERALAGLEKRRQELPYRSVWTVLLTGRRPTMLAGPAIRWSEVATALERWNPAAPRHDFGPAWDLGAQLAGDNARLLFLTDRLPDPDAPVPAKLEIVAFGEARPNLGISAAEWLRDGHGSSLFLRLQNHHSASATTTVRGVAGEMALFQREVAVPAEGSVSLQVPLQTAAAIVRVELSASDDALPLDSRVELVRPRPRIVPVAVTVAEPVAVQKLQAGLQAIPDVELVEQNSARLMFAQAEAGPPVAGTTWWVGVGPLPDITDAPAEPLDLTGPFVLERNHPLLQGVTLQGVLWAGVRPMTLPATPLITCGDHLLFGELDGAAAPAWLLNLDLARTNLAESLDWPILLTNLVEARRESLPGLRRWNYRLGEDVRFRLFEGGSESEPARSRALILRQGETQRPLVRSVVVDLPALSDVGLYELRDGDRLYDSFAVNFFDAIESDLRRLGSGHRSPADAEDVGFFPVDQPLTWWLLTAMILTLAAMLLDWRVLRQ